MHGSVCAQPTHVTQIHITAQTADLDGKLSLAATGTACLLHDITAYPFLLFFLLRLDPQNVCSSTGYCPGS